ncbi:MAG TPA: 8-oxo-dGTP diphosphatase MutT, partial [Enterobacteriaceae bacterium]|nr:8-oxo-dGTP diphosphatase MutT [Enterobacteriaceae bacterium]
IEAGETPEQALARELDEEVGITVTSAQLFEKLDYQYPELHITLWFYLVEGWEGEPWGKEGQPGEWLTPQALNADDFPPANQPIVARLRGE